MLLNGRWFDIHVYIIRDEKNNVTVEASIGNLVAYGKDIMETIENVVRMYAKHVSV